MFQLKKFLPVLLLFVVLGARAQYNPKEYKDFDGKKQLVFADNFDDDSNGWLSEEQAYIDTTSDTITVRNNYIIEGALQIHNTRMVYGTYIAFEMEMPVDFNRNYEIVFDGKITGENRKQDRGVIYWGRIHTGITGYNMYFGNNTLDAFYSSAQFDDSVHPDISRTRQVYTAFNYNGYNRYTIRHYNGKYYFFVNGILRCRMPAVPLRGKIMALGAGANAIGLFDNLSIYYLP